jgi:hypothetical protein
MIVSYIPVSAPSGWSAQIIVDAIRTDIPNNTTYLNFAFQVYKNSGTYSGDFSGTIGVTQVYDNSTNFLGNISSFNTTHNITSGSWITIFSGNMSVQHEESGYAAISIDCGVGSGNLNFSASKQQITLPYIIRNALVMSVPNFTDNDDSITIRYSNPNGATNLAACISFTGGNDDIPYRSIPDNDNSYTFDFTAQEKETLINGVTSGTSVKVRIYIRSVNGGNTFYDFKEATFSLTDALPHLQPVVIDMNNTTSALTGDVNTFIKYFSDAACQMNATAKMGATITSYKITNGDRVKNQELAQFTDVENPKFIFSATDNRGNTATETVIVSMIDYVKLTCNQKAEIKMDGETSAAIKLNISGNFFDDSFGAVNNTLKIEVRHTQNDGNMGDWVDLTQGLIPNLVGNTYNMEVNITGLAYDVTYTIQCRVTDKLMTVESSEYTTRLIPIFDWSNEDFNFNVPVNFQRGFTSSGGDYVVEQGTEAMGTNGTWYWSKWASGKAECYGLRNYGNMAVTTTWGGLFRSGSFNQNLPSGLFIDSPEVINISLQQGSMGGWVVRFEYEAPTSDTTGSFIVVRPASATISQAYMSFHIIGRWK